MTNQITLEEALKLVSFVQECYGEWRILDVHGSVRGYITGDVHGSVKGSIGGSVVGNVHGGVYGNVCGNIGGYVCGDVGGYVGGNVGGTINAKKWQFIETPKEKLKRLIEEGADKEQLMEALNQMDNN